MEDSFAAGKPVLPAVNKCFFFLSVYFKFYLPYGQEKRRNA